MTPALFSALRTALGLRLLTAVATLFRRFATWSPADEVVFAAQVLPIVQGSQRALASLTAVHVAAQASEALGRPIGPPGIRDAASVDLRAGVPPATPYRRPFVTVRFKISRGETPERAAELGEQRARQIADMDLQQTYAEASRAAMQALPEQPVGWRRVPTGTRSCARCLAAAVKVWPVDTLSPLHGNCDCRIEPVYGDAPDLDPALLERALVAADQLTKRPGAHRSAADVVALVDAMTPPHGELGAMLVNPRHEFTTAAELPPS